MTRMHFGIALLNFRVAVFVYVARRCRQAQTTPARSGTSRALNRQCHGGKFGYRSWTSGMLATQRFADRTPPFSALNILLSLLVFVRRLPVRLLPKYMCQRVRIFHRVCPRVSCSYMRL